MNKQEIYNRVKEHLLAQRVKSVTPNRDLQIVHCLYRGPNGTKCAIGALIPDEKYDPKMEGKDALPMLKEFPDALGFPVESEEERIFLSGLQQIHDWVLPKNWDMALTNFARARGLTP